ncbi:hypothetical protein ACH9EU_09355 [Kocuria sp. M1R5S2]|uniref:hypothetical protein n=1 Tax=Kocuria rhizosphaerae TaxID=3376285 RepID=UPI0037A3DBD4
MDDDVVGAVQARLTRYAVDRAGIEPARLWWHYFLLGGEAGALEVEAYLFGCLTLPPAHRDLLAGAANELLHGRPCPRIPSTREITGTPADVAAPGRHRTPDGGTRG